MIVPPRVPASPRGSGCAIPEGRLLVANTHTKPAPARPATTHGMAEGGRRTGCFGLVAMCRAWRGRGLERTKLGQHLRTIEQADVPGLYRRQLPDGPAQMHEMRLEGMAQGHHSTLFRQRIAFARIAGR